MKKLTLLLILLLSLVLMAAIVSGASARSMQGVVDGYEMLCEEGVPEEFWQEGNTLHIRGQTNRYRTFVDNTFPNAGRHIGTNLATVNVIMDANTFDGVVWGTYKSMPDDYPGSAWEGFFYGTLDGGLFNGKGLGYGTGEFSGLQMRTLNTEEVPFDQDFIPSGSCAPSADPQTMIHNRLKVSNLRE